ncbi:MAG: SpoIID/LytB domain-containing protein [Candidatus Omnitrophica bacterium]|nr:SpoIID/LytB domain-containing protein [Candidatus Omnitrophota bacterium]MDD5310488.1 SpoIID/LytB domain-containing protein [Candidatus Omnitrophota bacterium]MDD5546668.1 SpoIID/LytB domain-containing protein [Candidatus Omnitrophota bacterium]
MRTRLCFLTIFAAISVITAPAVHCLQEFTAAHDPVRVRVAVAKGADSVRIFIAGNFRIIDHLSKSVLLEEKYLPETGLIATDTGFGLDGKEISANAISVEPVGGSRVYINGRIFRGEIRVFKDGMKLTVVNTVDLEEYLYGVMRNEVSTWWPMEALKAQAIAARTYALSQIKESKAKDYDVTADVSSQVYGGIFSEKWRTNKAVDETRDQVLTYNGVIFPAFFHATCGGSTFDAAYLWNIDLPPLKGVKCRWCRKSPHFYWEKWMSVKEAEEKLAGAGYPVGDIIGFEAVKRDPFSARILELKIKGDKGEAVLLAKDFRRMIGADIVRSTNFKVTVIGEYVAFEGLGWGHGVGLCQWGAYYMSRAGKKADEILGFYYPGSKITYLKDAK